MPAIFASIFLVYKVTTRLAGGYDFNSGWYLFILLPYPSREA